MIGIRQCPLCGGTYWDDSWNLCPACDVSHLRANVMANPKLYHPDAVENVRLARRVSQAEAKARFDRAAKTP